MHISYILKDLRVLKMLARESMSGENWRRAQIKYSVLNYDFSDDQDDLLDD